jgi:hypothetical protein
MLNRFLAETSRPETGTLAEMILTLPAADALPR